MNIVFLIGRHNFYKYLSSIIEEGIIRGHTIECWCDYTQERKGMKGYLFPSFEKSPFFDCGHKNLKFQKITEEKSFEQLLKEKKVKNNVDYFIGLHQINVKLDKSILTYLSGKWCIIMHGIDSFYEVLSLPFVNKYKYKKYFFVYSDYFFQFGLDWINEFYPKKTLYFKKEDTEVKPIGSSIIGNKNKLSNIDKGKLRKKYGISDKKNIVLYLPFTVDEKWHIEENDAFLDAYSRIYYSKLKSLKRRKIKISYKEYLKVIFQNITFIIKIFQHVESRKYFLNRWNEPKVFEAVRKFCIKNNLLLVVKPRIKYEVTDYVRNYADIFIIDDEKKQYPSILQELFSIADLTIGYFSLAVLESVSFGVPYLNIESSKLEFRDQAHRSLFPNDEDSMFNFKSIVHNLSTSKMISDFGKMSIKDFKMEPKDRKKYMDKFVGPVDGTAAKRFYDYLENL